MTIRLLKAARGNSRRMWSTHYSASEAAWTVGNVGFPIRPDECSIMGTGVYRCAMRAQSDASLLAMAVAWAIFVSGPVVAEGNESVL